MTIEVLDANDKVQMASQITGLPESKVTRVVIHVDGRADSEVMVSVEYDKQSGQLTLHV